MLRDGLAKDLQKLVHEEIKVNFAKYPKIWDLKRPDKNIDHRRVPNLMAFFGRKHTELPIPVAGDKPEFLPGDIVTCTVPPHLPHDHDRQRQEELGGSAARDSQHRRRYAGGGSTWWFNLLKNP
ncbi:MAG: DUF1287 domain-containing protein [Akkermansiaceae bacterium]|nr:DUF1287 domain-containing protein [Akkermansiaceae bacterium]